MADFRTDVIIISPDDAGHDVSNIDNIDRVEIQKKYHIARSSKRNPCQMFTIQCAFDCVECGKRNIRVLSKFRKNSQLLCRNCLQPKRLESELRTDTIDISLDEVPEPHFPELYRITFTRKYGKSKRKNGNWKQSSIINCHWVCECGATTTRPLPGFRKNRSLLCANCLRRDASSKMMAENKEKYSKLGKENWKLGIGAWAEKNGDPMLHEDIKEKIKRTNFKRYGVENTLQSEELMRHVDLKEHARRGLEIKKVNGNYPSAPAVVEKFQQTMATKSDEEIEEIKAARLKTWHRNHDTPEKVRAIFECAKRIQGYADSRFGKMFYQSRYEQYFIKVCHDDLRISNLSRGPSIRYIASDCVRYMFPDFELSLVGQSTPHIIEIKSTYTAANDIDDIKKNKVVSK